MTDRKNEILKFVFVYSFFLLVFVYTEWKATCWQMRECLFCHVVCCCFELDIIDLEFLSRLDPVQK